MTIITDTYRLIYLSLFARARTHSFFFLSKVYFLDAVERCIYIMRDIRYQLSNKGLISPSSPLLDDRSLRFRWVGTTCAQVKVLGSAEFVALVSRPRSSLSLRPATISFSIAFLTRTTFPITHVILSYCICVTRVRTHKFQNSQRLCTNIFHKKLYINKKKKLKQKIK